MLLRGEERNGVCVWGGGEGGGRERKKVICFE